MPSNSNSIKKRLLSLDCLRGLDMLCIIGLDTLVRGIAYAEPNNKVFQILSKQFTHASWDGLHLYDLIFPIFVFIAGISFSFSLANQESQAKSFAHILFKIWKRGAILFLLGMILQGLMSFEFSDLRWCSVLGLIGISTSIGGTVAVFVKRKIYLSIVALSISSGIALIQYFYGGWTQSTCVNGKIDQLLVPGQLYDRVMDPEGILNMISASFLCILGIIIGRIIQDQLSMTNEKKKHTFCYLISIGIGLILLGYLFEPIIPVIKKMWTPTFSFYSGGIGVLLFTLFYWVIDVNNQGRYFMWLKVIGVNALAIYIGQWILDFNQINNLLFYGIANLFENIYTPIVLAGTCLLLKWGVLYYMDSKRVYIKI